MMRDGTPLGVAIDRLAAERPDAPAIVHGDEVRTRAQLARATNRLARVMAGEGVRQGDLVTIGLRNGIPFFEAVVAAWKLGAVPQPISFRLPPPELRKIIEIADPALVVGLESAAGAGRPWLPAGYTSPADVSAEPLPPAISPSWKAPTSGGSTGRPKLILSTTPGRHEQVTAMAPLAGIDADARLLCTGPLYHNGPFMFSLLALLMGGRVVVMDRFDASATLELVERHRITWLYLVPTMMSRILRLPADERAGRDLSSLRVAFHMAAPCAPAVKRGWIDWLGPQRIVEVYAATESQAVTMIRGDEWLAHPGSVGRVVVGEIEARDDAGRALGPGEVGQLWMRSADGRESYRYLGAEPVAAVGGWETLGDMGSFDADGYLHLADRRGDMILVGGANVYPAEIEAALEEHPDVLSSCAIGLPDDDLGNRVHAIVEARRPVAEEELHAHLAARLTPYKLPRSYELVDEPLRDEAGKLRRSALREARLELAGTPPE